MAARAAFLAHFSHAKHTVELAGKAYGLFFLA